MFRPPPAGGPVAGRNGAVNSVAFSPDGTTLASGNNNGSVQLWDVATHRPIGRLTGQSGAVNSVAFSPDGTTLASSSSGQTVRFWNVTAPGQNVANAADPARYLCALTGQSLTHAEWGTMGARAGLPTGLPLNARPQQRKLEDSRV